MKNLDWARCPNCGHKMFRIEDAGGSAVTIEIKCSSCKSIWAVQMGSLSSGETKSITEANKGLVGA